MTIKIPDFDDMTELASKIRALTNRRILLDVQIKFEEAQVTKLANTDEKYFVNGKPPSMSYVESTYKYTGFENELIPLRNELASVISELEESRLKFDIYRMQLDVYRTEAANNRATSVL